MANTKCFNISLLIPIYNEDQILEKEVLAINSEMVMLGFRDFEIVLCENGSTDNTIAVCKKIVKENMHIRFISYPQPNYGAALRNGILSCKSLYIVCLEIDFWSSTFILDALNQLQDGVDMVVGTKLGDGSHDNRPLVRRAISKAFNLLIRILLGFSGTDTHGMKAFKADSLQRIAELCSTDKDLFTTEFVVLAEKLGKNVVEIPLSVIELRPPRVGLIQRVPSAIKNLWKIFVVIRIKKQFYVKKST